MPLGVSGKPDNGQHNHYQSNQGQDENQHIAARLETVEILGDLMKLGIGQAGESLLDLRRSQADITQALRHYFRL